MVLNIWLYFSKCLFLSSFVETDYFTCQFNWTISFNPYLLRTELSVLYATFLICSGATVLRGRTRNGTRRVLNNEILLSRSLNNEILYVNHTFWHVNVGYTL